MIESYWVQNQIKLSQITIKFMQFVITRTCVKYCFYSFCNAKQKYFKTGIIFFLSSYIIGYGGVILACFLYLWTDNKIWIWSGSGIYGFPWILFGIGFVLAGKEGLNHFSRKNNET